MELRDVVVRFGYRAVLRRANLRISPGEGVGLVGENGAGKTTLLKVLALLIRPESGEVLLEGRPIGPEDIAPRRRIGYLGHEPGVYLEETGREHLAFAAGLYGVQGDLETWLRRAGLGHVEDERCRTYSRGMRQRLALARVLMTDPDFLLLDEPFTALDRAGRTWLAGELMARKARGKAHLVVSHDVESLGAVVDRILRLWHGKVVEVSRA